MKMEEDYVRMAHLAFMYTLYLYCTRSKRPALNSSIIRSCRKWLAVEFGWTRLENLDENACETGPSWRILPFCFTVLVSFLSLVLLFEGRIFQLFNSIVANVVFTYVARSSSRQSVLMVARGVSVHQLITVWLNGFDLLPQAVIYRVTVGRAMATMLFFDTLDEAFLHMFAFSWMLSDAHGWSSPLTLLPLKMCVFFLFPIQILGIREWICSLKLFSDGRSNEAKRQFLLGTVIPLVTILFSLSGGAEAPTSTNHLLFMRTIGAANVVFFILCARFGNQFDQLFVEDAVRSITETVTEVLEEARPSIGSWSLLDVVFILTLCACLILGNVQCGLTLSLLFVVGKFTNRMRWRTCVLLAHGCCLMECVWAHAVYGEALDARHKTTLVMLTTLRVLFAFERRPFAKMQQASCLFAALTAFAVRDNTLVPLLCFLLVSSLAVSIVVTLSREHSARMLKRESDGQAFLSHALKQKFSGVGGALEAVLETNGYLFETQDNAMINGLTSNEMQQLISSAVQECRKGETSCHAMNVLRNVKQRTYRAQRSVLSLRDTLEDWLGRGSLLLAERKIVYTGIKDCSLPVDLDWELFRVFLSHWTRGCRRLIVSCSSPSSSSSLSSSSSKLRAIKPNVVELRFQLLDPPSNVDTLSSLLLAHELRGTFVESSTFYLRAKSTVNIMKMIQKDQSTKVNVSSEPPSCNGSGKDMPSIPEGLSIAVLDDNTLVRKNAERMCRVHLKAKGEALFASGRTVDECRLFPRDIIEKGVDIAIVDENLDFEDGMVHISGTDLARYARANGFKGCLILHSAQSPTKALLDPCIDGFVEKTADREVFRSGISRAWKTYTRRAKREAGKDEEHSPVIEQAKLSQSS